jgi:hypothetical protein
MFVCAPALPASDGAGRVRLEIGACILEAPPELESHASALAATASRLLPRLQEDLGVVPRGPYRIFLIPAGTVEDPELRRLDAAAPAWAAGYLLPARRVGAIRLAQVRRYPHDDSASVLVHEATHMLLHDAAGGNLPRWFGEGVSTWEGRRWGLRDLWVYSSSLLTGRLPPLAELDGYFGQSRSRTRVAYAASFDFVSWTVRRHGRDSLRRILRQAGSQPFPRAWEAALGVSLASSEASWRRSSLLRYRWIPALTSATALWIGISALFLVAVARRRARSKEILARWDEEDLPPPPSETVH